MKNTILNNYHCFYVLFNTTVKYTRRACTNCVIYCFNNWIHFQFLTLFVKNEKFGLLERRKFKNTDVLLGHVQLWPSKSHSQCFEYHLNRTYVGFNSSVLLMVSFLLLIPLPAQVLSHTSMSTYYAIFKEL